MYREKVLDQIAAAKIPRVEILEIGRTYTF
jgi:hypothetical protein